MSDRRNAIDPAVASLLTEGEKKQRLRRSPQNVQAKARKQAARERVMLDIPRPIYNAIIEIAEAEGLSISAVASLFLADTARRYREQQIDLHGVKRPSRSPKVEWTVNREIVENVLSGEIRLAAEESEKMWR